MSYKNIAVVCAFVLALCVGVGYVKSSTKSRKVQAAEPEQRGALRQQIAKAKSKGEAHLNLPGLVANYEQVKDLEDALSRYTVVIGQLIEVKSYISEQDSVTSWYKFKVLDNVFQPAVSKSLDFIHPPAELLPLNDDEILIPRIGGTLSVDGISVVRSEQGFSAFEKSNKYLLFVLLDNVTKVGLPDLGVAGVLTVTDDDSLVSVNNQMLILEKELKSRYGETLPKIKEGLRGERGK